MLQNAQMYAVPRNDGSQALPPHMSPPCFNSDDEATAQEAARQSSNSASLDFVRCGEGILAGSGFVSERTMWRCGWEQPQATWRKSTRTASKRLEERPVERCSLPHQFRHPYHHQCHRCVHKAPEEVTSLRSDPRKSGLLRHVAFVAEVHEAAGSLTKEVA